MNSIVGKKGLFVDHLHIEGCKDLPPEEKRKYIRGLLCSNCNIALGNFQDDPALLKVAAEYLEHFNSSFIEKSNVILLKK